MDSTHSPRYVGKQRIFISYRRDDSQWVAGRLADSLAAYFGDDRVFRDIDGIVAGERFADVIDNTLSKADAVVVLIGKHWLTAADGQGRRRLDDPDDWVLQEVAAALDLEVPVYPVLVDDAPMPRTEELPTRLQALTRHNAISISDTRWRDDVARLGKIISLDIPSATERQLQTANLLISTLLFAAIAFTMTIVVSHLLHTGAGVDNWSPVEIFNWRDGDDPRSWLSRLLPWQGSATNDSGSGKCAHPPKREHIPIGTGQAGIIFVVMVPASALMFVLARHVDPGSRRLFLAAAWTGALGSLATFVVFYPVCSEYESTVIFYLGMLFAPLMLALMSLSRFRPR
jgi:hypothetical protein